MQHKDRKQQQVAKLAGAFLLLVGLAVAGAAQAQGTLERGQGATLSRETVLAVQTLAPALAAWPRDPSAFQALTHRPVLLELVPVADSPYFTVQGMTAALSRSAGEARTKSALDSSNSSSPLFICPVAAPRFAGGLVATALDRYEFNGDSGHAFVHLTRCEAVPAP